MVTENIYTYTREVQWKFQGGKGFQKAKNFKGEYKANETSGGVKMENMQIANFTVQKFLKQQR